LSDREPGQRQPNDHQDEHGWARRRPELLGIRLGAQVPGEKPSEGEVEGAHRGQPGQRHQQGESDERNVREVKGQQVGQIRHRKQQRGAVSQMGGGIGVWPHRGAQPPDGHEHDRSQQYHGGIEAEGGGDGGRDDEDPTQQHPRPNAPARDRRARSLEQALVIA